METYPGNSSLADEVKRRIVGTYQQSVDLAQRGRNQEAILGCDFVLELDPQFAPARALRERLSTGGAPTADEPAGAMPPLAAGVAAEPEADDLFDLGSLDALDLPDLDDDAVGDPAWSAPAPGSENGLEARLRERLAARDFQGVLEEAGREREAIAADPELARIAEAAQTRIEAQPYVEGFLREAGTAIRAGDLERADGILEKARSLDPDHPLLEGLEASLRQARGGAAPVPPASPQAAPEALGADFDDFDLLDGFEIPESSPSASSSISSGAAAGASSEPDLWEDAATAEAPPEDDLFSLDLPSDEALGAPGGLEGAPDLAAPPGDPAPAPASGPAPAPAAGSRGDGRIGELLAEGQEAADAGDYQGAIDAWSRIFLIDVDHQEAARRIETARRAKAERERKVEEVFHEGLSALEAGETDTARERFERVLEMQPSHLAARDYLRQIESGEPVKVNRGPGPDETVALGSLGSFDLSDLGGSRSGAAGDTLREEILVPPPPPGESAGERTAATAALPGYGGGKSSQTQPGRRSFLLVGGLVLLLVAAAGWWLFTNKDRFFPNSETEEAATATAAEAGAPGTIERATDLHQRGQTAMALGLLKRIPPNDPEHAEAQELIAQWEAPSAPPSEALEDSLPAETVERRARLLERAEAARSRGERLLAAELYDRAHQLAPLEGSDAERRQAVEEQLEPLGGEIELFELGEYEILLPRLWRLYEENRGDRDVRRMLVDSYYNRGVRELQRGNAAGAAREFEEALQVDPDDETIQRHYLFAQTYERRAKDLLYRIYVKYLPVR